MTCTTINLPSNLPVSWQVAEGETKVYIEGNHHDLGLIARGNRNEILAVELGMGACPELFTDEQVAGEHRRLGSVIGDDGNWIPGWRFRKEYLRDAASSRSQKVLDPSWLARQSANIREPLYRMDVDISPSAMTYEQARLGLPEGFGLGGSGSSKMTRGDDDIVLLHRQFWSMSQERRRDALRRCLVPKRDGRIDIWIRPDSPPPGLPVSYVTAKREFAIGSDISNGVRASETTALCFVRDSREQAAEFGSDRIIPGDFGLLLVGMARYYGNALVLPVSKMHGLTVIRAMIDQGRYTRIWHHRDPSRISSVQAEKLGWAKGEASDDLLFGTFVTAFHDGDIIIHSAELLRQLSQYVYDESGRVCHETLSSEPVEFRRRHGDRVIGGALAWRALLDLPLWTKAEKVDNAPVGSLNWRREQRHDGSF